ncbi:uracil phosphoribosyltransferase [Helicobacter equorum]|uniref:Phosphoribosyltransferase domain-containing protein n=1 Tax=Helicobacter equorum TaxID=361872 RepID=A0A3D8IN44_9HELI|nr:uracil phosphoribosyltransferase [Helicobacter equorum]RDU66054.1 hypothetical protein CQA54_08140 [Helicobacter equorum]
MNFCELQYKYPLQNLINQTRISDTTANVLAHIHHQFGILLGREILGIQPHIYKIEQLTQGKYENLVYHDDREFTIIGILRAGLYIAEGIREVFPNAQYFLLKTPQELESHIFKKVIIADGVINTGKTLDTFLATIRAEKYYIATNVIYEKSIKTILEHCPMANIFSIRCSTNSYVGQGNSDTGNRLFNTF